MPPTTVQFFATCLVETLRPQAGLAAVRLLERLGLTVHVPAGQTCCGQPAYNGGLWDQARPLARHTIDVLSRSDAPVVVPSGSCAEMIVHHYPELLADEPRYAGRACELAARTYEFSQFLVDVLGVSDVGARFDGRLAYHASCHLRRGLGVDAQPRLLLAHVRGAQLVDFDGADECCGFGGLFAVKMGPLSGAMLERKLRCLEASGAQAVVGCDFSCLMHIAGGLHRRRSPLQVRHLAEVLGEAGA